MTIEDPDCFDDLIALELATGDPPRLIAERLIAMTNHEHPGGDIAWDWYYAWREPREVDMLAWVIGRMRQSSNAKQTRRSSARLFGMSAEGFAAGDVDALASFDLTFQIDGAAKRLGDMTGKDHEVVSEQFQTLGVNNLLLAALHREVARVVGDKRTEEVLSEADYRKFFGAPKDAEDPFAEFLAS